MKSFLKLLGAASLLAGLFNVAQAGQVCNKSDWWCYEGGPSQNLTTYGRLDVSGNLSLNGNLSAPSVIPNSYTVSQIAALVPASVGQIIIVSNPTTFNAGGAGVCVSTGTAVGSFIQISSATAISVCK